MAASVALIKHKRQRDSFNEDDHDPQKRSRDGRLSELFSTDNGDCDPVENDLVFQVIKNLQEEINGTSEMGGNSRMTDEIEERATNDEVGKSPSSTQSGEENDNEGISNQFWSDLFENPSTSTGQSVDVVYPFLSHCYSYNYRDYVEYNTLFLSEDQQEWVQEAFKDLASQGCLALY